MLYPAARNYSNDGQCSGIDAQGSGTRPPQVLVTLPRGFERQASRSRLARENIISCAPDTIQYGYTLHMRSDTEDEAFRLLFESLKTLGIILQRAKKRNEFIIKPALKGCDTHLAISEDVRGLHRHIKNERAPLKSPHKYTQVQEIPEEALIRCFLDSLEGAETGLTEAKDSGNSPRNHTTEDMIDEFLSQATRKTRSHNVWMFDGPIDDMFSELARSNEGIERIAQLSKVFAESKRLPRVGRMTKTDESTMWKEGRVLALNRARTRLIMVLDESTVMDMSVVQLRSLVARVGKLMGLDDLLDTIGSKGQHNRSPKRLDSGR